MGIGKVPTPGVRGRGRSSEANSVWDETEIILKVFVLFDFKQNCS